MLENNKTQEFIRKLAPCIERGELDVCVEEAARVVKEMGMEAGKLLEISCYQEPQMNANERRFVFPVISSSKFLIDANTKNNHFFVHFAVKNRRLPIILWFENHKDHRVHREKWQPSGFSVYSVVDCLIKYSIFQKKLKSLTIIGNCSKPALKNPLKIFDHILNRGGIKS